MSGKTELLTQAELHTAYDERCREEFSTLYGRVKHLFVDLDIACPYGQPYVATFHQANFAPLSERVMELFLAAGYRRNGNCLYSMRCMDCRACLPIRLHPAEFQPSRSQRRTWRRNGDLTTQLLPLEASLEDIALCDTFLKTRYPMKHNRGASYFHDFFLNNIVNSARLQFRLGGKLIGASIIDVGYNWLNAVYFYFDPEQSHRSLGTFNILSLVDLCREWEIEFLYLGYLIRSVPAMSYKANFRPYYILEGEDWISCSAK